MALVSTDVLETPQHLEATDVAAAASKVRAEIERSVHGKADVIRLVVVTLLAEGHVLLEDVPGVGKTLLARSLAAATGGTHKRIQFTPDLLPSDVVGVRLWRPDGSVEFRPGPIFGQVVLADEINRASPKTQSAMLECMEERQVTIDGETTPLDRPFTVIATQNPIEQEGTYPLPEAELDRFLMRLSLGYPSQKAEMQILETHADGNGHHRPAAVSLDDLRRLIEAVATVSVPTLVKRGIVDLLNALRTHPRVHLGPSPRAGLMLLRAARASAATDGRNSVSPSDVIACAVPVLAHRVVPERGAAFDGVRGADLVHEALQGVAALRPR